MHNVKENIEVIDLLNLKFISQLDCKFLICLLRKKESECNIIVMIDQHAADERIKLEKFINEYYSSDGVLVKNFEHPITIEFDNINISLLMKYQKQFKEIGFFFEKCYHSNNVYALLVIGVPAVIFSRLVFNKDGISSLLKKIIVIYSTCDIIPNVKNMIIPDPILEVIKSKACR